MFCVRLNNCIFGTFRLSFVFIINQITGNTKTELRISINHLNQPCFVLIKLRINIIFLFSWIVLQFAVGRLGEPMTQRDLFSVIISNSIYRKSERVDTCMFLTSTDMYKVRKSRSIRPFRRTNFLGWVSLHVQFRRLIWNAFEKIISY
jgi:hypothetical protein